MTGVLLNLKRMVFLIPLGLLGVGLLARHTAQRAWTQFIHYQTPFAVSNPNAQTTPPIAAHVYLILVDGLRYDASREMTFLNELRRRGADFNCLVGLPSLSLPGRAVLMTGAWQEVNGQLSNFNAHPLTVETLFQVAKKKNLTTALSAGQKAHTMFDAFVDEKIVYPPSSEHEGFQDVARYEGQLHQVAAATRNLLRAQHPNLFFMDYTMTDEVAHDFGSTSSEYRTATRAIDEEIRKLAAEIDFSNSVLIVTSDHGHVDRGGHGGSEPQVMTVPLVLAGQGIQAGTSARARQIDVAPTVAALLGTEIPASSQGRILLEALQSSEAARPVLLGNLFQQRLNFTRNYLSFVLGAAATRNAPNLSDLSSVSRQTALDQIEAQAESAKQARRAMEPEARLKWVWPLMLLPGLTLCLSLWKKWVRFAELAYSLWSILIYWVVYFALFSAAHMAYSFTAVNVEEKLGQFFGKDMAFAVVALMVSLAVTTGVRMRKSNSSAWRWEVARFSYLATGLVGYTLLLKVSYAYWKHGLFPRWYVPDMYWGFGIYLDLLQLMMLGFMALLAPLPAWLGFKLLRPKAVAGEN